MNNVISTYTRAGVHRIINEEPRRHMLLVVRSRVARSVTDYFHETTAEFRAFPGVMSTGMGYVLERTIRRYYDGYSD